MVETIKYPTPMTKGSKEEGSAKREPEKKERNSPPKREHIRVKKKRCKDPSAMSEQWHRYFYIYPHQAARIRMQQNIKEGIAFAKESVSYRMPMPVLRLKRMLIDDARKEIEIEKEKALTSLKKEVGGLVTTSPYSSESDGTINYFTTDTSRIKKLSNGTGAANIWWLRSPGVGSSTHFCYVTTTGAVNDYGTSASNSNGVCFGFCI